MAAPKAELRRELRAALRGVTPEESASWSRAIVDRVADSAEWARAPRVLIFAPMAGEVDIRPLARLGWGQGKAVGVPRVDWKAGRMRGVRVEDWDRDLSPGEQGVMEPRPGLPELTPDLVVAPGLGFDLRGFRLGRGGGFYDRYLESLGESAARIGVAFDMQIRAELPISHHDQRMDAVVTERRRIDAPGRTTNHGST